MSIILNCWRVLILVSIGATALTGLAGQEIAFPIGVVCVVVSVLYLAGSFVMIFVPYSWACDWAGTHFPGNKQSFDGCSLHSVCQKCGREVMLDGQGNWF